MKWVLIGVAVVVGLALLVAAIGFILPRGHVVSRTAHYDVPAESLWAAIADYASQASWRPELERVEPLPARDGRPVWREHVRGGPPLTLENVLEDPPRRLIRRIADPDLPFGGSWIYDLQPGEEGATLRITEKGEVHNPFFRFFARIFMDPAATVEAYMQALGDRFGMEIEVRESA